jgi:hypothetical protein
MRTATVHPSRVFQSWLGKGYTGNCRSLVLRQVVLQNNDSQEEATDLLTESINQPQSIVVDKSVANRIRRWKISILKLVAFCNDEWMGAQWKRDKVEQSNILQIPRTTRLLFTYSTKRTNRVVSLTDSFRCVQHAANDTNYGQVIGNTSPKQNRLIRRRSPLL